jgi:hypothetical protein
MDARRAKGRQGQEPCQENEAKQGGGQGEPTDAQEVTADRRRCKAGEQQDGRSGDGDQVRLNPKGAIGQMSQEN